MKKQFKILIILVVFIGLGIGGYFGYREFISENPKNIEEEKYGNFTKADFADVIEPLYKRTISPNVDILPEEIERVTKLTTKQLETLYRKQWGVYNERINVPKAIKEFLESNGYKGPGWLVWVLVDEDPNINYRPEIIFENKEGRLTLHYYTLR